jgi:hypothetical protein
MWLVHASCNQSEALRTDRSSKSMPRGPHAAVDSISARLDAKVSSPGVSSRLPMKPSLAAVGPTARSVSSEEARERRDATYDCWLIREMRLPTEAAPQRVETCGSGLALGW